MPVVASPHPVLSTLLRHLPPRLLAALDDWSLRVARRHAERRRQVAASRQAARS